MYQLNMYFFAFTIVVGLPNFAAVWWDLQCACTQYTLGGYSSWWTGWQIARMYLAITTIIITLSTFS